MLHPDLDQSRLTPIEDDADLAEVIDTHSIDEKKLAAAGRYTLVAPEDLLEPAVGQVARDGRGVPHDGVP